MSESSSPSEFEDFAETPSSDTVQKGSSTLARLRQTVLFFVLAVCLVGLAWEYLGARAGYVRCSTYLSELQDDFNSATATAVQGDDNGEGIENRFTADNIREVIGVKPYKVDEFGDGAAIIEYYQWRRANIYSVYDLAVLYQRRGANKTMVFGDWYQDMEEVPLNPSRLVAVDESKALPPEDPNVTGGVGTGGGGGESRRRRERTREEDSEESSNGESDESQEATDKPDADEASSDESSETTEDEEDSETEDETDDVNSDEEESSSKPKEENEAG
ncbi:MAG: hypothetical protein VXX11_00400 [Planctomycetota bacterium]|nr:hypothetical protein [Planctomycetota bacterium]